MIQEWYCENYERHCIVRHAFSTTWLRLGSSFIWSWKPVHRLQILVHFRESCTRNNHVYFIATMCSHFCTLTANLQSCKQFLAYSIHDHIAYTQRQSIRLSIQLQCLCHLLSHYLQLSTCAKHNGKTLCNSYTQQILCTYYRVVLNSQCL